MIDYRIVERKQDGNIYFVIQVRGVFFFWWEDYCWYDNWTLLFKKREFAEEKLKWLKFG